MRCSTTQPDVLRPAAALRLAASDLDPGTYLFFLYLLNVQSFRSGLEFLPVVVSLEGHVNEAISSQLLTLMGDVRAEPAGFGPMTMSWMPLWQVAETWVADHIRERENELATISDQIIDRRVASLQEGFDRWVAHRRRLLEQAESQGHESIARLHRGYIPRREGELAEKLRELESQRSVQIGQELVAGGAIEIESVPA